MSEQEGFKPGGLGCGDGPHLHTPDEGAALLRIPESTLRRKAGARKYPSTKVGRYLLFSDEDLLAIIALSQRTIATPRRTRRSSR